MTKLIHFILLLSMFTPVWFNETCFAKAPTHGILTLPTVNHLEDPYLSPEILETVQLYAQTFIGTPYLYGGETEEVGIDCSSFTQKFYSTFGIPLPRMAKAQSTTHNLRDVNSSSEGLRPLDLLFFKERTRGGITHVAIYLGNGRMIHAAQSKGKGVVIEKFAGSEYWRKRFYKAKRPIGVWF